MSRTSRVIPAVGVLDPQNYFPLSQESTMRVTHCFLLASIALGSPVLGSSNVQGAAVNVANLKPIIGGSNNLEGGAYSSTTSNFSTDNVTDGQTATPDNNTGSITEVFANDGYWLGPAKPVSQALPPSFFVLDLGSAFAIDQIVLFNTSNGAPQERGTGDFTVKASNSIATNATPALGNDLSGTIVTLVSSTLLAENNPPTAVVAQSFASADNVNTFRYIRFDALTVAALAGANGAGLNEIRLISIPEPGSISLFILGFFGVAGAKRAAKRRSAAEIVFDQQG